MNLVNLDLLEDAPVNEGALPLPEGVVAKIDCIGISYIHAPTGRIVFQHPYDNDAARKCVWLAMENVL